MCYLLKALVKYWHFCVEIIFFLILYLHFLTSDTQCDQGITDRNKDCIQSQISYVFHGNIYLSDFNIKLNVLLLMCDAIQI